MDRSLKLFAEPECWNFKAAYELDWDNFGCGPGDFADYLVPDSIIGVDVSECCRIHDWYYRLWEGKTEDDRAYADRVFLNNMLRTVTHHTGRKWKVRLRCFIAHAYYKSVRKYGAPAFFEERNQSADYREV